MNRFLFIFFFLNSLIYGYDFIVENEKCKICDIYRPNLLILVNLGYEIAIGQRQT